MNLMHFQLIIFLLQDKELVVCINIIKENLSAQNILIY